MAVSMTVAAPAAARPVAAVSAAKRSSFVTGSARLSAAPRAQTGALLSARARQAATIEARASKTAAGKQIQVDVEKPLGLILDQSRSPKGGLVVKSASGNAAKVGAARAPPDGCRCSALPLTSRGLRPCIRPSSLFLP